MNKFTKWGIVLIFIVAFVLPISVSQTEKQKIGFNAFLEPSNPTIKDTIMIKMELVNPTSYKIRVPPLTLRYEIHYEGPGEKLTRYGEDLNKIQDWKEITSEIVIDGRSKFSLPPFFPEEYNKRKDEDRIGEWTINLELSPRTSAVGYIEYYDEESREWKSAYWLELEKVSNPIKFEIKKIRG
jgi:hypothetical protein